MLIEFLNSLLSSTMAYQNKKTLNKKTAKSNLAVFYMFFLDQIKNQLWQIINKYVVHQALNL